MRLLLFLMESFIKTFGITPPKPGKERTAALVLGGFLLFCIVGFGAALAWMLFGVQR